MTDKEVEIEYREQIENNYERLIKKKRIAENVRLIYDRVMKRGESIRVISKEYKLNKDQVTVILKYLCKTNILHFRKNLRVVNQDLRKLSDEKVRYIRKNPDKLSLNKLAKLFSVTRTAIKRISKKESYKSVPDQGKIFKPDPEKIAELKKVKKSQRKLTAEQVRYIKRNPENLSLQQLAQKLRFNRTTISNIHNKKTYKEII